MEHNAVINELNRENWRRRNLDFGHGASGAGSGSSVGALVGEGLGGALAYVADAETEEQAGQRARFGVGDLLEEGVCGLVAHAIEG